MSKQYVTDIKPDDRDEERITCSDKVLVIYAGGTIGSAPRDREDPESPKIVRPWRDLKASVKGLQKLPFRTDVISFKDPFDSVNVEPKHWTAMAEAIKKYHSRYTGIVILHGTDTMVYTASALSFMLQNIYFPVVITGAQLSAIDNLRNDAEQNLISALLIANYRYSKIPCVPEVCIFFRDKLIRGNRCKKVDASGYSAFDSFNYPLLGIAGDNIDIKDMFLLKKPISEFQIQPVLNTDVIVINVFPGLQQNISLFQKLFQTPKLRGVVLKTYGAGNAPTNPKFLDIIRRAVRDGVIVINVTQCIKGDVRQGLYETSAALQDIGVISGQDITPEAALCKLMNVIGDDENYPDVSAKKARIRQNIAGEQACTIFTAIADPDPGKVDTRKGLDGRYRSVPLHIRGFGNPERALIRFIGAEIQNAGKLLIKIFLNLPEEAEPDESGKWFAGSFVKSRLDKGNKRTFTFDIAEALVRNPEKPTSLTVYAEPYAKGHGVFLWERLELTIFARV